MTARAITAAVIAAAACLAAGCKKVVYDCDYRVKCFVQDVSGGPEYPLAGAPAYAFYGDTSRYTVASYEDALEGVVTERRSGSKHSCEVSTTTGESGEAVLPLTGTPVILIVCCPEERLYAWREAKVGAGLGDIYVSLRFRPWRESAEYTEAKWTVVNQFYTPKEVTEEANAESGLN